MPLKRRRSAGDWLAAVGAPRPAGELPTGEAFRGEWLDFDRGIRVGNLEPHERITQILKYHLEQRHRTPFVTDRWGRGVFWQWICWLPRANRQAKPVSHDVNFGCAKLFISVDQEEKTFKSGLQVERGYVSGAEADEPWGLRRDWDWHRLVRQCRSGSALDGELRRLLRREGFTAAVLDESEDGHLFTKRNYRSAAQVRTAMNRCSRRHWAGFQLYYAMPAREVRSCSGYELVKAMVGVFGEVTPAMNLCMQVPLTRAANAPGRRQRTP